MEPYGDILSLRLNDMACFAFYRGGMLLTASIACLSTIPGVLPAFLQGLCNGANYWRDVLHETCTTAGQSSALNLDPFTKVLSLATALQCIMEDRTVRQKLLDYFPLLEEAMQAILVGGHWLILALKKGSILMY